MATRLKTFQSLEIRIPRIHRELEGAVNPDERTRGAINFAWIIFLDVLIL